MGFRGCLGLGGLAQAVVVGFTAGREFGVSGFKVWRGLELRVLCFHAASRAWVTSRL